ncbi:MAG TPA: AAA family ATPase, partial [Chloroflexota bacterium]|nr:AAA family ATPase [Chloroflexota bacterium]
AFYQAQVPDPAIATWGDRERIKFNTTENFRQTADFVGVTVSSAAVAAIQAYTDGFLTQHADLFAARVRNGWIRDCHGDLHAAHIHLAPRSVCIFDCIEFNDRFRSIDVASDLAFLAMDLDHAGHPDLADFFVRWMIRALIDPEMARIIDFYKCYRAYVRGKVESLRGVEQEVPDVERQASREAARRYFRLALQYAVAGSEPTIIVTMGRIASGKSTLARHLADELGWEIVASDQVRKERAGIPTRGRPSDEVRSWLYSPEAIEATYDVLLRVAEERLRGGRSLILDATFSRPDHRERLVDVLTTMGARYCVVEAQAPDVERRRRLRERDAHGNEVSDARLENLDALDQTYEPPVEISPLHFLAVNTNQPSQATVELTLVGLVHRHLESPLARPD